MAKRPLKPNSALDDATPRAIGVAAPGVSAYASASDHVHNGTAGAVGAHVAALGTTTNLTAIGATFADLPAARTAVNTLRTDAEARLDAIEAKVDALIASLQTAGTLAAA